MVLLVWAQVTGRARLGGMPVGVVAVETATVMRHQPADPGLPDSTELNLPQAGQVRRPLCASFAGRLCPRVLAHATRAVERSRRARWGRRVWPGVVSRQRDQDGGGH